LSVVVWDGTTLAADRMGAYADDSAYRVKKIDQINFPEGKHLYGWAGTHYLGIQMMNWFRNMQDSPAPAAQHDDHFIRVLEIKPDREIWLWEGTVCWRIDEPFFAIGAGREYAIGAMAHGATASEAVEIASRFYMGCGLGVDALTL